MAVKVADDIRIKQAKIELNKRHMSNVRIAKYKHNKMLKVSKKLREDLKKQSFSSDDYFALLEKIHVSQGRKIHDEILKNSIAKRQIIAKGDIGNGASKKSGQHK